MPQRNRLLSSTAGVPRRWELVAAALILGLAAEALYGVIVHPWARTFSAALLYSLASLVAGGLFGFLFGLPHTGGTSSAKGAAPGASSSNNEATGAVTPSTNLQQIADWLTKLIIGAGLVQLGRVPSEAAKLFNSMSHAFGTAPSGPAVAGAIVIYYAGLGFLTGWLATYFFVTPAVVRMENAASALLEQSSILSGKAAQAELSGNQAKAQQLRSASAEQETRARALYEAAYTSSKFEPGRVSAMDQAIDEAARAVLAAKPTDNDVLAMYSTAGRQREIALATMALQPSLASLESVVGSIASSATGNEQYQALRAAQSLLPTLDGPAKARLKEAIEAAVVSGGHIAQGTARYALAQVLIAQL